MQIWPLPLFLGSHGSYFFKSVLCCVVHVCFVQVTLLSIVWRSRHADAPRCVQFSIDICCAIQEGVITVPIKESAPRRVRSATRCHLDKTNMDKTSQHLQIRDKFVYRRPLRSPLSLLGDLWARIDLSAVFLCQFRRICLDDRHQRVDHPLVVTVAHPGIPLQY